MGAARNQKGTVEAPPGGRRLDCTPQASRKKSAPETCKLGAAQSGSSINQPRLVTRAELARIAGVSPMAITKATRRKLEPALLGDHVHVDHPAVAAYLASRGLALPQDIKLAATQGQLKPRGIFQRIDERLARIERHLGIPEDTDA